MKVMALVHHGLLGLSASYGTLYWLRNSVVAAGSV